MDFKNFLKHKNAQKRINNLAKKYKNKKIVIYGAGLFSRAIFADYDLTGLNIIAVADIKYNENSEEKFFGYKCISPNEINSIDYDVILIANSNYSFFLPTVKNIINNKKKVRIDYFFNIKPYHKKIILKFIYPLYCLLNPNIMGMNIIRLIFRLKTFYITNSDKKIDTIKRISRKITTQVFGCQVLLTAKSVGEGFWCGGISSVTRKTVLKDHVHFNGMRIFGNGNVTIGRYFHSGLGCMIITQSHNYNRGEAIPYDSKLVVEDVEIGDFVWFGARVTILPGTKIGEGVIVQAGSVVHGEIPPYAIIGGNPAKVFKYRDIEHFKKLKSEEKFL